MFDATCNTEPDPPSPGHQRHRALPTGQRGRDRLEPVVPPRSLRLFRMIPGSSSPGSNQAECEENGNGATSCIKGEFVKFVGPGATVGAGNGQGAEERRGRHPAHQVTLAYDPAAMVRVAPGRQRHRGTALAERCHVASSWPIGLGPPRTVGAWSRERACGSSTRRRSTCSSCASPSMPSSWTARAGWFGSSRIFARGGSCSGRVARRDCVELPAGSVRPTGTPSATSCGSSRSTRLTPRNRPIGA